MASGPDLFVVCKKCGSEVSPYITECPYCGTRLRKRAPKLERGGVPKEPGAARRRRPTLGRLRPGEIPGIRADRRPYATIALVVASLVVTLGAKANLWEVHRLLLTFDTTDEYYRTVTTLFVYGSTGYEIVALGAIFLFGWLLERRHGPWAPLLVFLAGGAGGMFLAIAGDDVGIVSNGGNGAALALLAAWAMRDVLGRRRGVEDDSDLLGALAIAAVLILLPLATEEASALAGLGGGVVGVVLGVLLARLREG
ncbi:MAG TPA: rhomboid family intramembrane serine protease [Solirubrobacteraceae bacterium]|nr:rhomboid family intramembrane serine protease [Solirubrobacteraceae bacterium]